jgi:hypothetical protein
MGGGGADCLMGAGSGECYDLATCHRNDRGECSLWKV